MVDDGGTSNHLLLLGREEKLVSFVGFGGEIALIGQEKVEVDHILINKHASDAPSEVGSKGIFNDTIDSVADESLSISRVTNAS